MGTRPVENKARGKVIHRPVLSCIPRAARDDEQIKDMVCQILPKTMTMIFVRSRAALVTYHAESVYQGHFQALTMLADWEGKTKEGRLPCSGVLRGHLVVRN